MLKTRVSLIGKSAIAPDIQGPIYRQSVQELDIASRSDDGVGCNLATRSAKTDMEQACLVVHLSGACNHLHSDDVCGCSTLLDRLNRAGKGGVLRHGLQPNCAL